MCAKPRIGLNADLRDVKKDAPAYSYLAAGYYQALLECDVIPIVFPPMEKEEDLEQILDLVDGFVFIGGGDLDPMNDGFMRHPTVRPLAPRREQFDRRLMNLISDRRIPVLGIGVGMQLLNVSQGGNLFLHLPEDLPHALPHKDPLDPGHRHGLEVTPGSMMESVYGDGEIRVNSFHHMAVDEVAPGFEVTARALDGVIEAIESRIDGWLAVGTQFHPESETASALDMRIFESFIEGITGELPAVKMVA